MGGEGQKAGGRSGQGIGREGAEGEEPQEGGAEEGLEAGRARVGQ